MSLGKAETVFVCGSRKGWDRRIPEFAAFTFKDMRVAALSLISCPAKRIGDTRGYAAGYGCSGIYPKGGTPHPLFERHLF